MDRELTPEEIVELLPAYALDAVDDDERAEIDAYLTGHPDARDDVAEFQVAASLLAHAGGPPPEGVWERLESIITDSPTSAPGRARRRASSLDRSPAAGPAPGPTVAVAGGRRGGRRRWRSAVSGSPTRRRRRRHDRRPPRWRAPRPRHRVRVTSTLTDADGTTLATAVVTPDGTGYLTSSSRRLRRGHTYQLWGITTTGTDLAGRARSRTRSTVAFKAAVPTQSLAITTEVAGGVPVSHNAPDAVGDIVDHLTYAGRRFLAFSIRVARRAEHLASSPQLRGESAWQSTTRGCATCSSSRKTCTPTR